MTTAFILSKDRELSAQLQADLAKLGFEVTVFSEIDRCVKACGFNPPDMLIINCRPDKCNYFISQLRQAWQTEESLILLIIPPETLDQLTVDNQVDDIVLTNYNFKELAIRLKLLLSRTQRQIETDKIVVGQMTIDPRSYEVRIGDHPVLLTYREYELLRFLVSNRGRVFTRKALIEKIWQYDFLSGSRTVDVHIRRLRAKLGPRYGSLIETVRNVGYRFTRHLPSWGKLL